TVPSAIRELLRVNGVPKSVQVVNLAGEPLPTPLVEQIYSGTSAKKVYDLYGPTETTTYSTFTLRKPGEPATIGKPLANEQVYLLDAYQNPVPVGVPGEIYIGGDGVTRGYLNRPELTAEKFISNLFRPGGRLYKTGDLGKWRPDGNIQFLGRIDYQVKIRGFRIELGEIESALKKHAGIREAVVLAREDQPGDKRLAAYIVSNGKAPAIDELRQSLREHLPEFMVPSAFVFLEALPLTPNGKVDRKALPVPEQDRNAAATEFAAARTPTEENICAIWRDLLGLKQVGIRDNFFDLGGNSLLAIRVISRIRETTKLELPLSVLFDTPTIEMLAAGLEANRWGEQTETEVTLTKVSRSAPLPVSFVQERLWFLDQLLPGSHAYHVPAALRLHGPLDTDALTDALNAIAVRHEVLRTSFTYADGELAQVIQPQINLELPVTDVSTSPVDKKETQARQAVNALAHAAFDLSRGPLIRAGLVRLDTDEHVLAVVMHHSISDGWSLSVFFRELESLYRAQTSGQSAPLADLPFQYADYAAWKRQSMQGPALQKELAFWKERLAGAPPELELPTDHSEPAQPTRHCARLNLEIPQRMRQAITELGQRESASPFIVVTAALAITLHKWTGQRDLVVGTVVAGRNRRELEQLLGCFMNFLPLRLRVRSGHIGTQVLAEARKAILEAQNHQECPFEKMVEAINPERKLNQNPLYNVALLFQNFPGASFSSDGVSCEAFPVDMEAALLDLRFEAEEKGETLSIACEYRTELFEAATIEQVMAAFRQTLELLTEKPQTALAQFPVPAAGKSEKAVASAPKQRIAITGTFTTEPLNDPLRYWLKELGVRASVEFAPYNQVFQQLLDSWSLLARNDTGLNVILLRIEDWQRVQAHEEHTSTNRNGNGHTDHSRTVERSAKEFVAALKAATARTSTPHLVCICPASTQVTSDPAKSGALSRVEKSLVAELEKVTGVYLLTTQDLNLWYPVKDFYDASSDELGHVPYTPVFFTALATGIARKFHALKRAPYKVIALDCDNTLWSGVCGEDGAKGIRLEPAFLALHKFMRAQLDAGMLLCVCSKNNEQDVYEVFEQRLEMPLRREHFASWRLNWKPKSENLKSLAR
ncbi:MAG TPA: HAD-IIIC family phosphatase, partial [Candidatus Dormibacteraeota bacterium]|nr:HAD-IIIC family phosphatase [Candidatus Dormibacteraeota bacterium]